MLGGLTLRLILAPRSISISEAASFITACVSFLTLIIGLLKIITKYCFPENDEEYVTKIVQSIQKNDLQHKLASIDYKRKTEENREAADDTASNPN